MKADVTVELKPFNIPTFVLLANTEFAEGFPLSMIDPYTLEALCDQFRTEVFKKAGKQRPPQTTYKYNMIER
jgi:hypothetical protein